VDAIVADDIQEATSVAAPVANLSTAASAEAASPPPPLAEAETIVEIPNRHVERPTLRPHSPSPASDESASG